MVYLPLWIGLMLAVPVGLVVTLVGLALWLVTRHKGVGLAVSAVGVIVCLGSALAFLALGLPL